MSIDKASRLERRRLLVGTALASCLAMAGTPALGQALPSGGVGTPGITITDNMAGTRTDIVLAATNGVITWDNFSVGAGNVVSFTSGGATAVLNRVNAGGPLSQINGTITAPGISVWLSNPNGVTFGPAGNFSGGGLVLTTAAINQANFLSGDAKLLTITEANDAAVTLTAGGGTIAATGSIVVVAQRITTGKTLSADSDASGNGDVALVAATDVTLPNAFGSPLGITITRGTAVATARVDASGTIRGASVQLLGASRTAATEALLQVTGTGTTLQATRADDGRVVIAAGAGVADVGFVLAPAAAGDTAAVAPVALAGTIGGVTANADTIIAGNGDIGGTALLRAAGSNGDVRLLAGGAIGGTLGNGLMLGADTLTVTAGAGADVALAAITTASDFALATSGNITTGAIDAGSGNVTLGTSAGDIATAAITGTDVTLTADAGAVSVSGVIDAGDDVIVTASGEAAIDRVDAGGNVAIAGNDGVRFAGGTATGDVQVTAAAGLAAVTGAVTTDGDYAVTGADVELGTDDATLVGQSAAGRVAIRATAAAGSVTGLGVLTLQSNSGGEALGDITRLLELRAGGDIAFATTTSLLAGPARQSTLTLDAGGDIALGTVAARRIAERLLPLVADFDTAGDFGATAVATSDDLLLASSGGEIAITGLARSFDGRVGLAGDSVAAGSVRADDAIDITANAGGITLGGVTAGGDVMISNAAAAAGDIAINGAIATDGNVVVDGVNDVAIGSFATGSIASADDILIQANETILVAGAVTARDDLEIRGGRVTLGTVGQTVVQAAQGFVAVSSDAGDIRGLGTLTLQSNSEGADDGGDNRGLALDAAGGEIDFAATTTLRAGDAGRQSIISLISDGSLTLGTLAARRLAPTTGGIFDVAAAFTAGNVTVSEALNIRTSSALRLGDVVVDAGDLMLTGSSVEASGTRASDGDLFVTATGGAIELGTVFAAGNAQIGNRPGAVFDVEVTSLTTTANGDASIRSTGSATLATATTAGDLVVDGAVTATVTGNVTAGGDYSVIGGNVILGTPGAATQSSAGAVTVTAATGGIAGRGSLVLTSNRDNAGAEALTLRAGGAGGIDFAAGTALIGGTTAGGVANRSADVLILGPVATLALGRVDARTLQGITTIDPVAGPVADPRAVTVTGDAILRGAVTLAGGFRLTSTGDGILAQGAIQAGNSVVLRAVDDIALVSVDASAGDIDIATTAGNVRGTGALSPMQAAFAIGALTPSGDIDINLPDNAIIGAINGSGAIRIRGGNLRLGSVATDGGDIDIATTGDLTGNLGGVAAVAPIAGPNLTANGALGSVIVVAGGVGQPQTVQLGDVSADRDVTITADAIAVNGVTATNGTALLTATSSLVVGALAGNDIQFVTPAANADPGPAGAPFVGDLLDSRFGSTDISATANGATILVVADRLAQLGIVAAGTSDSVGVDRQVDILGTEVAIVSASARNGAVYAASSAGPLYIGTLRSANGAFLDKNGGTAEARNELRLGSGGAVTTGTAAGSNGVLFVRSESDIRLGGPIVAQTGNIDIAVDPGFVGDITGLAAAGATGLVPNFGRGDLTAAAGGATIAVAGAGNVQLGSVVAGSGTGPATPGQIAVTAGAIDITDASARDGALGLTATVGRLYFGTGEADTTATLEKQALADDLRVSERLSAGGDIVIRSGTDARLAGGTVDRFIRSTSGDISVIAARDVTGLAGPDTLATGIAIDNLGGGTVSVASVGDMVIGAISTSGDVTLDGANVRLGSAATTAGDIDITASRALTGSAVGGTPLAPIAGGDLFAAGGSISVSANAGAAARQVQLGTVSAGLDVDISADRIAVDSVTAGGTATLAAGSALVLGSISGNVVTLDGDGGSDVSDPVGDYAGALPTLDTRFGETALAATGTGRAITATVGGIAQLGTVTAGLAGASAGPVTAIDIDAAAVTVDTITAFNGAIDVTATNGPLLVGAIAADRGVTLAKQGLAATDPAGQPYLGSNELRIGSIAAATPAGAVGAVSLTSATNLRLGSADTAGNILILALDGDVTGLAGSADGLDGTHGRIALASDGDIGVTSGGLTQLGVVTASGDIRITAGDALTPGLRLDSGAIDLLQANADGVLALTSEGRTGAAGTDWNGDIRIGATAAGQRQAGIAATTAASAALTTLGDRGDIIIASALAAGGAATIDAIGNARLAGGDAVPFTDNFVRAGSNLTVIARTGDITGLAPAPAAADGRPRPDFGRADLTAAVVTMRADNGALQIGSVTADASGSGDQLVGNARDIDILAARAAGGNLRLTATPGNILVDTADIVGDAILSAVSGTSVIHNFSSVSGNITITANEILLTEATIGGNATLIAVTDARIEALTTTDGNISVTAAGGDLTGLAIGLDFDRAILTAGGTGSITLTAANGAILGGAITAGTPGTPLATDQILALARDIDISSATANNGNIDLTATGDALDPAVGNIRLGSGMAQGDIVLTALDGDVTGAAGLADGLDPTHDRLGLAAGRNVTITSGGLTQLGLVTAADIRVTAGDAIDPGVRLDSGAIDIAQATADGVLALTAQGRTSAPGTSWNGDIRIGATAGGTALALIPATTAGSATLQTLGTRGDVIIATALDVTGDASIAAAANARLAGGDAVPFSDHFIRAGGGLRVTAGSGDITGLGLAPNSSGPRVNFGRADLAARAIDLFAGNGAIQLGNAIADAGVSGDQLVGSAEDIDIVIAEARDGDLLLTATGDAGDSEVGNLRLGTGTSAGAITLVALDGDITGVDSVADGLDPLRGRMALTAGNDVTITAGGLVQAGLVSAAMGDIDVAAGDAVVPGIRLDSGAIDIGRAVAGDALVLTAAGRDAAAGKTWNGDIRLGATAAGLARDPVEPTMAASAAITTPGDRGDVILAAPVMVAGNALVDAVGHARVAALMTATGDIAVTARGGDITGLALGDDFSRTNIVSGDNGIIVLSAAAGRISGATITAGVAGAAAVGDQLTATARSIDIDDATASNGNLRLTATTGDLRVADATAQGDAIMTATAGLARLDTASAITGGLSITAGEIVLADGDAATDTTLLAADSARIGALATMMGSIDVTASGGDITGLVIDAVAGRADLTSGGNGGITLAAANGSVLAGAVLAGAAGSDTGLDQLVATAETIDITTASAGTGSIVLAATAGDVRLGSGTAAGSATVTASAAAAIGVLTARSAAIAIDAGDIALGTGEAATTATLLAVNSARIGSLTTAGGDIFVTANSGDITGLADGDGFGRAVLRSGGNGIITLAAANGGISGAEVSAGISGSASGIDQLIAEARSIDITTASAGSGNMILTATAGDVRVGSGSAAGSVAIGASGTAALDAITATAGDLVVDAGDIVIGAGDAGGLAGLTAANSVRLGTLRATRPVTVTATIGDISGLADGDGFGRADIASGGTAAVTLTASAGTIRGGTVTAGTAGSTTGADQLVADARGIDITTATASNGNLALAASAGDVVIGTGSAAGAALVTASGTADLGAITAGSGAFEVTAAEIAIGSGSAGGDATLAAAGNARVDELASSGGDILVTATGGDIEGRNGGNAVFGTAAAGKTITLTADTGRLTLGAVTANAGDIVMTARDTRINGNVATAAANSIRVIRGTATAASETRIGSVATDDDTRATLNLDAAEINRLNAGTVQIVSAPLAGKTGADVKIGTLALDADTAATRLQLLGTGAVEMTGTISDAGAAVARTLQIGGDAELLPESGSITAATPLALRIDATIRAASSGTGTPIIALPEATVDLRAARISFVDATLGTLLRGRVDSLGDAAAAALVSNDFISTAGSDLYLRYGQNGDVFLTARLLQVSYSSFALFQNTGVSSTGGGTVLGTAGNSVVAPAVLELRSFGSETRNAFALFGTINGFQGRTAGALPGAVVEFADDGSSGRLVRISQPDSRLNGCVIGSPDRGCLVTDIPPPAIRFLDERQLQLFGVADDLTVPFDPLVGTANETLIGDITTTGNVVPGDCSVPGTQGCPVPGERQ